MPTTPLFFLIDDPTPCPLALPATKTKSSQLHRNSMFVASFDYQRHHAAWHRHHRFAAGVDRKVFDERRVEPNMEQTDERKEAKSYLDPRSWTQDLGPRIPDPGSRRRIYTNQNKYNTHTQQTSMHIKQIRTHINKTHQHDTHLTHIKRL